MKTKNMQNLVTIPSPADELIQSQYGMLNYGKWCELEVGRLRRGGVRAQVVCVGNEVAVARI